MPVTIKSGLMKYKSSSTGTYVGINAVSDNETATQIAAIDAAGTAQVSAVQQKGAEVIEDIPSDYTQLSEDVSDLKNAINVLKPEASSSDIGKALIVKTVEDGEVTEYEYGEAGGGGGGSVDPQDIAEAVDEWCDENITNPSNPPLDRSLSLENAAAPADVVGDIKTLLVDSVENVTPLSVLSQETYKLIGSSGDISAGTLSNQIVYAFTVTGYDALQFYFTGRLAGEAKYAFYSAETLAGCSSETLVGTVNSYTSAATNNVNVPSGANTVVIGAKSMTSMKGIARYMVSKADASIADSYNTSRVYYVGEYCTYDGATYRRKVYTGEIEAWDATKWEQTKPTTESRKIYELLSDSAYFDDSLFQIGTVNSLGEITTSQQYRVVNTNIFHITETTVLEYASGYAVTIYYYDSNGEYLANNGGLTSEYSRTIMKDSYVRIVITIAESTTTLETYEIRKLVHAVSFATEHAKQVATIEENAEGTMKALAAKMFQKGGAPVAFTKSPCILVAGQSNIDGRVPKEDLPSSITPPFANMYFNGNVTNGNFTNPMTANISVGIDFSMYAALNDLGTPWYIIKRSMGGTSISPFGDSTYHWTPFYEELDDISKSLLYTFHQQIKACDPSLFDFRALLWQQGEGDRSATSKRAALEYYKNFRCLIAYIRGITGNERLPVVCGTVSHLSGQYDKTVEEATLRLAEEDPYMICIDMSGATLLDAYHFDAASAVYFGYKAYDALIDLGVVTGTKINPVCPW